MEDISQERCGPRCAALGYSRAQRGRLVSLQGGQQLPAPQGTSAWGKPVSPLHPS